MSWVGFPRSRPWDEHLYISNLLRRCSQENLEREELSKNMVSGKVLHMTAVSWSHRGPLECVMTSKQRQERWAFIYHTHQSLAQGYPRGEMLPAFWVFRQHGSVPWDSSQQYRLLEKHTEAQGRCAQKRSSRWSGQSTDSVHHKDGEASWAIREYRRVIANTA